METMLLDGLLLFSGCLRCWFCFAFFNKKQNRRGSSYL